MTSPADWVAGARPRTLWTSIAPVAAGTAAAAELGSFRPLHALLALVVGLALQIASNYANDYADGIKGTDVDRIGPTRLVASGKARPSAVKRAAFISMGVGFAAGLALVIVSAQWWLILVGGAAGFAAWAYTATSRPYGYNGWGEVMVFIFFGPVAMLGTMLTQAGSVTWWAVVGSAALGLVAVSLLMVNNIRDVEGDTVAGKRTLAVKLGAHRTRVLFVWVMALPMIAAVVMSFAVPWVLVALLTLAPAAVIAVVVRAGAAGPALKPVFIGLTWFGTAYGALLTLGIVLS